MDTATDKVTSIIHDPADGDIHGGVFVQYKSDGKGGVVGEVVSDYSGLHGSALAAERAYVAQPTLTISLDRNGFQQPSLMLVAKPGDSVRLTVKNVAGTSGGKVTFSSKDMGISTITLGPGQSQQLNWTVPANFSTGQALTSAGTNTSVSISLTAAQPAASTTPGATSSVHQIVLTGKGMKWDVTAVTVKASEQVQFVITDLDDEKHNLVGISPGMNLLTPDAGTGKTITYNWTAPSKPGVYKATCAYHPAMVLMITVQ
jgi:plastocyanin